MRYKVIRCFLDKTDNNHFYKVGDEYPRENVEVTEKRVKELLAPNKVTGQIYLAEIPEQADEVAEQGEKVAEQGEKVAEQGEKVAETKEAKTKKK